MQQLRMTIKERARRQSRLLLGATLLLGAGAMLSGCHIDMWVQPKIKAYYQSDFFADQQGSRPLVPGAIAQGTAKQEDPTYFTGRDATGKLVKTIPVRAVTAFASPGEMLKRGQDRYEAYCTPCHGRVGNGNGFIAQRGLGYWQKLPATFHSARLRKIEDGHIYTVLVNGQGVMYGYAARIQNVDDRWAVVAYIRALQLARQSSPALLSADERERTQMQQKNDAGTPTGGLRTGEPGPAGVPGGAQIAPGAGPSRGDGAAAPASPSANASPAPETTGAAAAAAGRGGGTGTPPAPNSAAGNPAAANSAGGTRP